MTNIKQNTEKITYLYDSVLNKRMLNKLEDIVSKNYTNSQGGNGVEGFSNGIVALLKGFEDARWSVREMISEDNKVMVWQEMTGTHTATFQGIAPTLQQVKTEGIAIYYFKDGKIVSHRIQTDRLGFLQQLGILPKNFSTQPSEIYFVDRFNVPRDAFEAFAKRVKYNRNFIKTLPGFVKDMVMMRTEPDGDIIYITIAQWENEKSLEEAKLKVKEEYRRIGFNPTEFTKSLGITILREEFRNQPD